MYFQIHYIFLIVILIGLLKFGKTEDSEETTVKPKPTCIYSCSSYCDPTMKNYFASNGSCSMQFHNKGCLKSFNDSQRCVDKDAAGKFH